MGFRARLAVTGAGGKLASQPLARHKSFMRIIIPLALALLAGCASTPESEPVRPTTSAPLLSNKHEHDNANGMTQVDLVEHLGSAKAQVREGEGLKLQFAGPNCVLDAYLYPPASGQGVPRVSHTDARDFQGQPYSPKACIASIEGR